METFISIWILHIVVVTCALDQVKDDIIQTEQFQQEMIEKFSNLNLKFDQLRTSLLSDYPLKPY